MKHIDLVKSAAAVSAAFALSACASVYPLEKMGKRASDDVSLRQDIRVDAVDNEAARVSKLAWAAYSVTFECPKTCPYSLEERRALAREIAETSFTAFDQSLRKALASSAHAVAGREILDTEAVVRSVTFGQDIKTDSFKIRVSRWLAQLGLSRNPEVTVSARALKAINPAELGWSGGQSLAALGKAVGVDGVLVGHISVAPDADAEPSSRRLVITGPQLWVFSTSSGQPIAIARLKPKWRPDLRLQGALQNVSQFTWDGLGEMAAGYGSRVVEALDL